MLPDDSVRGIPPAILHDEHALEYASILEELPPSPGVQLWQVLRGVTLWISTPAEARRGLFSGAGLGLAEVPDEIGDALDTLQVAIRTSADDQRRLIPACLHVSEWAERQGYLATALAYAQACALAAPENPELACRVGRLAMEHAEYTRAESWYRRALALARRSRSWDTYGLCFIGLGNLNRQRGRLPAAEQYFRHALARAKQDRRSTLAAMANHDLFALALRRGHIERAEQYARRACGQYPPGDSRLFRLANDVAYHWICSGQFARAIPVLLAMLPHAESSAVRLAVLANLVRAAGGARQAGIFGEAWSAAVTASRVSGAEGILAESLLDMARGAASCGEWQKAESSAQSALRRARTWGQAQIVFEAEALLDALRSDERVQCLAPVEEVGAPPSDRLDLRLIAALTLRP